MEVCSYQCRFCGESLTVSFIDLGMSPLANSFRPFIKKEESEIFYPLHVYVCTKCFLVQTHTIILDDIFTDYAYFSSYSQTWLSHCKTYVDNVCAEFNISPKKSVVEIASNDGYLLQYFVEKGIPVLGVEPARNIAKVAIEERGIPTICEFWGKKTAQCITNRYGNADLLIANNVLAHVPDINDFISGLKIGLAPDGIITMEFPHLLALIKNNLFDTIYHEHYSYFSLFVLQKIMQVHGLKIFKVAQLNTHGGSLRIYVSHTNNSEYKVDVSVTNIIAMEKQNGLCELSGYSDFSAKIEALKWDTLLFLTKLKKRHKRIAAFGAPAKGNTIINYLGVKNDLIEFTVDETPYKQNTLLPGSHIPVYSIDMLFDKTPDYVIILPWNWKKEIYTKIKSISKWGGKALVLIPKIEFLGESHYKKQHD